MKFAPVFALALALASLAALPCVADTLTMTTMPCTGIPNVSVLTSGHVCTANGNTYSDFSSAFGGYGANAFSSVVVGLIDTQTEGDYTNSQFQVTTTPEEIVDLHTGSFFWLRYTVTAAPGEMFDSVKLDNIDGHGVMMFETVCASSFADNYGECPAADLLGSAIAPGGFSAEIDLSRQVNQLFERKFFQFDDASITRFDNGVGTVTAATPEPGSVLLLGTGLGLIALGWKKRRVGNR